MSIQALPATTVRVIGASQVLTDPSSVVKELVDNALDARASSVFVEISANTLDVIQVRDSGHGIISEDRAMVCRRYCTSKIRHYSDLKDIGGKWLGFRGEALASAAELSGTLTLTTRVEGEDVATALRVGKSGEVEGRDRASHPVGTTVRITDLFKFLPVRKQTSLKSALQCLNKTKRMMQAYALAKPAVRYSLRVLKAKNDKGNWMYAPKADGNVEDAAFKIVGKECASQCAWSVLETDHYEVQAFLPRQDAEYSKINNMGHFVSIDSRPVSTARGTLKQVMTMFREKLRECKPNMEAVKDPFLCLNIVCPPASYDPNVEPAKDDVIFADSSKVLAAVQHLLEQCYPAMVAPESLSPNRVSGLNERYEISESDEEVKRPLKRQCTWRPNMYGSDEVDDQILNDIRSTTASEDEEEERSSLRDATVSNPWVIAKMNAPLRPRRSTSIRNGKLLIPLHERNTSEMNSSSASEIIDLPTHLPWALPTPQPSSPPLRSPVCCGSEESNEEIPNIRESTRAHVPPLHNTQPCTAEDTEMHSVSANLRPHRQKPSPHIEEATIMNVDPPSVRPAPRYTGWRAVNDFVTAGQLPVGTPYTATTPSVRTSLDPSPTVARRHTTLRTAAHFRPHRQRPSPQVEETTMTEVEPAKARRAPKYTGWRTMNDFVTAGQLPLGIQRQTTTSRAVPPLVPSPEAGTRTPTLHTAINQAHANARAKLTRTRSTNLPLERIPHGWGVHNVIATLSITISALSALSLQLQSLASPTEGVDSSGWDSPIAGSEEEQEITSTLLQPPPTDDTVEAWREQIIAFLAERGEGGEGWEEEIDVAGALRGHVAGCL